MGSKGKLPGEVRAMHAPPMGADRPSAESATPGAVIFRLQEQKRQPGGAVRVKRTRLSSADLCL